MDTSDQNGHLTSYYPVTDYGAKGDGITDDTAPIQAAIEDAIDGGGGIVFFPAGKYRTTDTLRTRAEANVVLEGVGNGSTIFIDSESATVLQIGSGEDREFYHGAAQDQGSRYITVRSLTIDRRAPPVDTSTGIEIGDSSFTTVRDVTCHNHGRGITIGVEGGTGIPAQFTSIVNCRLDASGSVFENYGFPDAAIKVFTSADMNIKGTAIMPTNVGIDMAGNANAVLVNQCTIRNEDEYRYGILSRGTGFARYINNTTITGASEAQFRARAFCRSITINGSWFGADEGSKTALRGIDINEEVARVQITGSHIVGHTLEGVRVGGAADVILTNNTIVDNASGESRDSVVIFDDQQHAKIENNRIWSENDRYGIYLKDNADKYIVMGNDLTHRESGKSTGDRLQNDASGETGIIVNNLGAEDQ